MWACGEQIYNSICVLYEPEHTCCRACALTIHIPESLNEVVKYINRSNRSLCLIG